MRAKPGEIGCPLGGIRIPWRRRPLGLRSQTPRLAAKWADSPAPDPHQIYAIVKSISSVTSDLMGFPVLYL